MDLQLDSRAGNGKRHSDSDYSHRDMKKKKEEKYRFQLPINCQCIQCGSIIAKDASVKVEDAKFGSIRFKCFCGGTIEFKPSLISGLYRLVASGGFRVEQLPPPIEKKPKYVPPPSRFRSSKCDVLFTTSENCSHKYVKRQTSEERVEMPILPPSPLKGLRRDFYNFRLPSFSQHYLSSGDYHYSSFR